MDGLLHTEYVSLDLFEEIVGTLESIHRTEVYIFVHLSSGTLRYKTQSREAEICSKRLEGKKGRMYRFSEFPIQLSQ